MACVDNPTYPVTVTVTGLLGTGNTEDSVELQNNGANTITVLSDGTFSFSAELQDGDSYDVTVSFQPDTQTCTVTNGMGTVAGAPVTGPAVNCVDNPASVNDVPVPTLDRYGLALLMLLLGIGAIGIRRFY